ncbi:hypothetical protein MLD38_020542 [Melastoma candidum]|uniref:Uncharacterized protein n=1 Tax=Melastoma candidum TaxID=119954 RepID=A0ACB9QF60_9MYRT|nr:hypothetical protein MLD38_020542 [Melastoma candidum]
MGRRGLVLKPFFFPSLPRSRLSSSQIYRRGSGLCYGRDHVSYFVPKVYFCDLPNSMDGLLDPSDAPSPDFDPKKFEFLRESLSRGISNAAEWSSDAVLIANVIRDFDDGVGEKSQKFLRQFREQLGESLVVEILRTLGNRELGVKFFIWAGRQIGYSHSNAVYDALLDMMGCHNGKVPESLLKEVGGDDKEVLGKLLNVLIQKFCRNGAWDMALKEVGRLKDFGYRPTKVTYNALVQVLVEANSLDTASLVHREMMDLGFCMDVSTLNNFAYALCKYGKWREALLLIEDEEFIPDTVIYTKMIAGLCEASLFDDAMNFLDRMRASSCFPNVVTYNVLLSGFLKKRQLGRCKRILGIMITEGCYPSPGIFNSLVHAFCKSREHPYAHKLMRKMVKCGYRPGYVVYNILIGGLCGDDVAPNLDILALAEKIYSEMLDAGILMNKVNVTRLAGCLCRAGKFERAHAVIREMMGKGFVPDTSTYSKVIAFLCDSSVVDKAVSLFVEMKSNGVVPDVHTYTVLIDTFCKAGIIEQADKWFAEMVRDGCPPNVVTYTTLIHAHVKAKKLTYANELFERMLAEGCTPNVVTYSALIDGLCKAGELHMACSLYSKMKGNIDSSDDAMVFKINEQVKVDEPNVFTYGALIDGLCKAQKVREANELLDVMYENGCEPNQIVYDALIDGLCKSGRLDEAQKVFTRMTDCGHNPNIYTYSSLIDRMFKDKRLDLALKVISRMLEDSVAPNVVIYTEMIDGLCKVGKVEEAYKLLLMMEEKGCNPNVVTYTAMIDGFGKAGQLEKCFELFEQMGSKNCAPNFVTYAVLINRCCAVGMLDKAYDLLNEMRQTYWPRHLSGYRKVIGGFSREFIASLGLLDEISSSELELIVPIYKILMDNYVRAGRLGMALDLYEDVKTSLVTSQDKTNVYASLIESLSLAGEVEKAFELFADMLRVNCMPELSTFVHLVKGLVRLSKWDEILQLSDGVCQMKNQQVLGISKR